MADKAHITPFIHLHVHSAYSIGEGLSTPAEICAYANLAGYKSIALTDTNGTFGFMEFHREAKKLDIKPIYGAVVFHEAQSTGGSGRFRLGVIAISRVGLRNLSILASLSLARFNKEQALSLGDLKKHSEGLIALAGCWESEAAHCIILDRREEAREVIKSIGSAFPDRLVVEIQDNGDKEDRALAAELLGLASELGHRPVLTLDVRYVGREKRDVFGLLSVTTSSGQDEGFFPSKHDSLERNLKSPQEMLPLHDLYRTACENTIYVDSLVPGDLMDDFTASGEGAVIKRFTRDHEDPMKILADKVLRRFILYFHDLTRTENRLMREVLEAELEMISSAGLAEVFLLFHEIILALRKARMRTGPATGLTLQSLSAYLLNITGFNPYGDNEDFRPILDRASDSSRILEIQIASEDRNAAVRALKGLFDNNHIAFIPGIERLTPARALKAAARKLEISDDELGEVLRIVMQHHGISLMKVCEESKALGAIFNKSARVRELIKKAAMLEGLPTGFIKSRRSIVVGFTPIRDFLGVFSDETSREVFIQSTKDAFPVGNLYRIDFTPLGSLSVCMRTERDLLKHRRKVHEWDDLPKDDEKVWTEIQKGESIGIYMLERSHIKKQCSEFAPQSIDNLTDFLALMRFRPDEKTFAERIEEYKSQTLPDCDYKPELMAILGKMRGMILYEEQLRDILLVLTGVNVAEAVRMLRRFRSEDPGMLSTLRKEFMRHTANEDIPMEEATRWFEKILYHASRTVNRQRIRADALLVYKMFYLKTYHPSYFFLSLLNTYWDNEAKVKMYLAYLLELRMLLPVDINKSDLYFTLEGDRIRLGLHMIEGIGYPAILQILNARTRRRRFKSLEDFIRRTKGRGVAMETVGKLIMLGAFDFTGISRTNMINALPELYEDPGIGSTKALKDQLELPFVQAQRMQANGTGGDLMEMLLSEKTTGNREAELQKDYIVLSALENFYTQRSASLVEIAGQVSNIQRLKTNSGKILGFFVLFDFSAFVHVFIPWDRFGQFSGEIEEGKKVIVRGRVNVRDEKKICEALAIRAFAEGASDDGEKDPDEPAKRNP